MTLSTASLTTGRGLTSPGLLGHRQHRVTEKCGRACNTWSDAISWGSGKAATTQKLDATLHSSSLHNRFYFFMHIGSKPSNVTTAHALGAA